MIGPGAVGFATHHPGDIGGPEPGAVARAGGLGSKDGGDGRGGGGRRRRGEGRRRRRWADLELQGRALSCRRRRPLRLEEVPGTSAPVTSPDEAELEQHVRQRFHLISAIS
jgi:hypothetical protein